MRDLATNAEFKSAGGTELFLSPPDSMRSGVNKRRPCGMDGPFPPIFLFTEDITGENPDPPRHVRRYGDVGQTIAQAHRERVDALRAFHHDVAESQFPGPAESVAMAKGEGKKLRLQLETLG